MDASCHHYGMLSRGARRNSSPVPRIRRHKVSHCDLDRSDACKCPCTFHKHIHVARCTPCLMECSGRHKPNLLRIACNIFHWHSWSARGRRGRIKATFLNEESKRLIMVCFDSFKLVTQQLFCKKHKVRREERKTNGWKIKLFNDRSMEYWYLWI